MEEKDYHTELYNLYQKTYSGFNPNIKFDEISTLTDEDGKKYVIGLSRSQEKEYTDFGNYKPFLYSKNVIFVANIDDNNNLTGDSVKIEAISWDEHYHSEAYINRMLHQSNKELLGKKNAFTCVSVGINNKDELPRVKVHSGGDISGNMYDKITFINGYCNVVDRLAILEALNSKKYTDNYDNRKENKLISSICSKFLIPNTEDEMYRKMEETRKKEQEATQKRQFDRDKNKALRLFIKKAKAQYKDLGKLGSSKRKVLKLHAKRLLPSLIKEVQEKEKEKQERRLNQKKDWNNFRTFVQAIMDSR